MSNVFGRGKDLPVAVATEGCWVEDADGRRYLDAAGGAIVSAVGHGRERVVGAIARQLETVDYVHSVSFRTEIVERYAAALAGVLPVDDPRVYPVAGGSEATETALKLARSVQLARGEGHRVTLLSREGSYHGNSLGALDVSGRKRLRAPYEPWLGRAAHLPAVNEYRCPNPAHPDRCGAWHATLLEEEIVRRGDVAALIAESVGGATLGAAVPPDDYWPRVAEICRRHGVVLIVDEVMAGFGRTGSWFGIDHWGVHPDILIAGKGAASGYWPLGLCVASGEIYSSVESTGFVHGFTFSHHGAGAAAGLEVLKIIEEEELVEAARVKGEHLIGMLRAALTHPQVGDIRGIGLLIGVEFVADRSSKEPFPPSARITDRVMAAARQAGLLTYAGRGVATGDTGDAVLLGPPLTISDEEIDQVVDRLASAVTSLWPTEFGH
ncbi:MAG TPA: aminotransferase class III-fold pyridoxal phosphate-dependent enzyme [Acidimicrobiia bacterium]|nr:aminotransferase class III-fold pyridoxal phosphate-dependent enzyme [Acidimicrobiia bacterium]